VKFRITILSDPDSWLNDSIPQLVDDWKTDRHLVNWVSDRKDISIGDFCFILSFSHKVEKKFLERNKHNLVVHESALPNGKGWSPLSWQILEGKCAIPISLFEATEEIDSGVIYLQKNMNFVGNELLNELHLKQMDSTFALCKEFVESYPDILKCSVHQSGEETFYSKRNPSDSKINPNLSIVDQFNLLRIVDNKKYPAYFELYGCKFELTINKVS